jgi:hypothetical protein
VPGSQIEDANGTASIHDEIRYAVCGGIIMGAMARANSTVGFSSATVFPVADTPHAARLRLVVEIPLTRKEKEPCIVPRYAGDRLLRNAADSVSADSRWRTF